MFPIEGNVANAAAVDVKGSSCGGGPDPTNEVGQPGSIESRGTGEGNRTAQYVVGPWIRCRGRRGDGGVAGEADCPAPGS